MRRLFDFVANTSDGAFAVDCGQRILLWNSSAEAILGHREDAVAGRKCFEIVRGREACGDAFCQSGCRVLQSVRRRQLPRVSEVAAQTAGGKTVWLSMSTIVVPSAQGSISALIHVFREITRRHDLLDKVQALAEEISKPSPSTFRSGLPRRGATGLTPRERQILRRLMAGHSTNQIAERLFLSRRTVRNHVGSILEKLGVHSRLEAVLYCVRDRLS